MLSILRKKMKAETVISLCDKSGNMLVDWAKAGYRCIAVDIQHKGREVENGIEYVEADVLNYLPPRTNYRAAFAFPPCSHLATSGARWFKDKGLGALRDSIALVEACRRILEWTEAPYCLENPVGTLSTYWRKADFMFDPYEYGGYLMPKGDQYTKKTCLWTGNGFIMPEKRPVEVTQGSKMLMLPDSKGRAFLRSETPKGFARAVFEANNQGER